MKKSDKKKLIVHRLFNDNYNNPTDRLNDIEALIKMEAPKVDGEGYQVDVSIIRGGYTYLYKIGKDIVSDDKLAQYQLYSSDPTKHPLLTNSIFDELFDSPKKAIGSHDKPTTPRIIRILTEKLDDKNRFELIKDIALLEHKKNSISEEFTPDVNPKISNLYYDVVLQLYQKKSPIINAKQLAEYAGVKAYNQAHSKNTLRKFFSSRLFTTFTGMTLSVGVALGLVALGASAITAFAGFIIASFVSVGGYYLAFRNNNTYAIKEAKAAREAVLEKYSNNDITHLKDQSITAGNSNTVFPKKDYETHVKNSKRYDVLQSVITKSKDFYPLSKKILNHSYSNPEDRLNDIEKLITLEADKTIGDSHDSMTAIDLQIIKGGYKYLYEQGKSIVSEQKLARYKKYWEMPFKHPLVGGSIIERMMFLPRTTLGSNLVTTTPKIVQLLHDNHVIKDAKGRKEAGVKKYTDKIQLEKDLKVMSR